MSKLFFAATSAVFLLFIVPMQSQAQIIGGAPLLSGCVGTCASTYTDSFIAPDDGVYVLTASSSLCPNTTALGFVYVNWNVVFANPLTNGLQYRFEAKKGDLVVMTAALGPSGDPTQCVWLGNVNFAIQ